MSRRRYGLTEREWSIIAPLLPSKPRGVPRVDDRMVLNGILWRFRTGSSWSEITERYGIATTCYNRFVRWRRAGVWDRLLEAVSEAYAIRKTTAERKIWANIPPKSNREDVFAFSPWVYRQRNLVERFFNRIKHYRGIATRYDKNPDNFLAVVKLIAVRIWCISL